MPRENVFWKRRGAPADVLHQEGPRARERGAKDHREQADGGGSPPPARGARSEEGQGGAEASDGEGQGGSRTQVGRTRLKTKQRRGPACARGASSKFLVPSGPLSTSLQRGRPLEGFGSLVRAYYQDRAGSVVDNPIGDTPLDGPPYPPVAPATH